MILFAGKYIIPFDRVYTMYYLGSKIHIMFDSGVGKFENGVDECVVDCESEDECLKIFRQFYKAVASGSNAFFIK